MSAKVILPLLALLGICASSGMAAEPALSATSSPTPEISGTDLLSPSLSGTDLAAPAMSGTDVSTPAISGTDVSTPVLSGTDLDVPDVSGTGAKAAMTSGSTEVSASGAFHPKTVPPPAPDAMTLTQDRAIELALHQNPDILEAEQEIERTRGLVIEVRAQALPRAALTSDFEQQDRELFEPRGLHRTASSFDASQFSSLLKATGTSGTSRPVVIVLPILTSSRSPVVDKTWHVSLEVRQLLYSGGQVRSALNIAKFTQDSSYYQLRDTIDRVISTVRTQFYQVLLTRALIAVREENLGLTEEQLQDQQNRFEAGTVARFNVLRAEVEVANARPDLIRAQNAYRIAQWRLAKILGIPFDEKNPNASPIRAVGKWVTPPSPAPLGDLLAMARQERAFLRVQQLNLASAREQIRLEQGGYLPKVEAFGGVMGRNSPVSPDLEDTNYGWYYGVNGSWNVFDGLATYGRVKQARAKFAEARISYEDALRQVDLEIQEAYSRVMEAKQVLASQEKALESADETLRLAVERFAAGAGTQLDVLDARTARSQAQVTQLQARYDYYAALSELDRATGVDTQYLAVPGAPIRRTGPELAEVKKTAATPAPAKKPIGWWWKHKEEQTTVKKETVVKTSDGKEQKR